MVVLVDEEILKNHLEVDEVKEVTEVEALLDPVEIDQIEILVAIEDPLDLEESEEKEDKTKFYSHKKTIKNDGFFMCNNYFF